MTTALDGMERLINEADSKFEEKFKQVQRGAPTNLNAYSDRTYNLRQQVAHNTQLTSDEHFMQLLHDTERLLAAEYTVRGEVDKKLYALLAGLLKTLLRETVALPNYSSRKIQLEMVWQWYHDKKGHILEWSMERDRLEKQQQQRVGTSATEPSVTISGGGSGSAGQTSPTKQQTSGSEGAFADISEINVTGVGQSSRHQMGVASKFAAKFDKVRADALSSQQQPLRDGADTSAPSQLQKSVEPLEFTREAQKGRQHAVIAKKLCLYKKRNLQRSERIRQDALKKATVSGSSDANAAQVTVIYSKDAQKRQQKATDARKNAQSSSLCYGPSGPGTFIHHQSRAPEFNSDPTKPSGGGPSGNLTQTEKLDRAVAHSQKHWVSHMVKKLEEEQDEKQFKDSMVMFEINQARVEEESTRRMESSKYSAQAGRTCHTILRREPTTTQRTSTKGGATEEQQQTSTAQPVTVQSTLPSAQLTQEEIANMLGIVTYTGTECTSLCPYDHYQPTPLDERKLQALLTRVKTPDTAHQDARTRLGLKSPHPRSMASTSTKNTDLDVQLAPDAQITNTQLPSSTVPVMELLYPALSVQEDVPSLNRMNQMKLVERIRECFARTTTKDGRSYHVPRKTIESAILTPDDRPYEECIRLLPRPGSGLPADPNPRKEANAKKKGGKAKKK